MKNDLYCLMTNRENLKFILVEIDDKKIDFNVYLVTDKQYPLKADSYLWHGHTGIPMPRKFYIPNL